MGSASNSARKATDGILCPPMTGIEPASLIHHIKEGMLSKEILNYLLCLLLLTCQFGQAVQTMAQLHYQIQLLLSQWISPSYIKVSMA